jgi:hypothetical protein
LCSFIHASVTSSFLGPNILLSTLFSNTIKLCSYLNVTDQVSHHQYIPKADPFSSNTSFFHWAFIVVYPSAKSENNDDKGVFWVVALCSYCLAQELGVVQPVFTSLCKAQILQLG